MTDEFSVGDVEVTRSGGRYGSIEGLDIYVGHGVTLLFASLNEDGTGIGIWGVKIGDKIYREPRDLTPEPLEAGPIRDLLELAVKEAGGPHTAYVPDAIASAKDQGKDAR